MRQFIVVGRNAPTTDEFALDDLPAAGRMDLLARCVTASLLLSHGLRESVQTHLVLGDEFTVRFEGENLRGLHPDERSTAALIRSALAEREEAIGQIPVEVSSGVSLVRMDLDATLATVSEQSEIYRLHPDGTPKSERSPPESPAFVLSNHQEFHDDDAETIAEYAAGEICLGPKAIHADHAIAVTHNWLDTDG
ncbi:tRNA (pseudouridine(54)-N(1))-methyltransferase TrmY [Halovenus sp. WSH3]|uniref:tRNA (pseudouridine(54)-N(1))-methyltransferase n=1 Tax=Halovenus carboxidivorans TaxID=2692199 RepID=A0A6B0TAP1_9EURY|nr:tRNA (pseudouridine(54)-N(1))-methyltransferase TrmY [Halovenus carboxidivorans]MXR51950.1 tRNA (pseudouridine(54)-N(1))-methyltransferase TrmY [Halovenus carboxidivorans]